MLADLCALGALVKNEDYALNIGKCARCAPLSNRWSPRSGSSRPSRWPKRHRSRERAASFLFRQLEQDLLRVDVQHPRLVHLATVWWGHRVPAWHCQECHEIIVAREAPATCDRCGSPTWAGYRRARYLVQPGLWPFSTLGWPDQTEDLKAFYPTSLLIHRFDILFFWVARWSLLGIEFMGDVPFPPVYSTAWCATPSGRKCRRRKATQSTRLIVTEKYGTDAVRMRCCTKALRRAPTSC